MKLNKTGGKDIWADASDDMMLSALMYLYHVHQKTTDEKQRGYCGFRSSDAPLLCGIAEQVGMSNFITERQLWVVRYKIPEYWKRLEKSPWSNYKVEFQVVPSPQKKAQPTTTPIKPAAVVVGKHLTILEDGDIRLDFAYDKDLIENIKKLSGRQYHSIESQRYWTCPVNRQNLLALKRLGFTIPKVLEPKMAVPKYSFDFSGLKTTLRPYQVAGATRIAGEMNLRALLADEQGLGKTGQALAALYARRDVAFPALIVCPGSLKWNWAREIVKWLGDDYTIRILNGRPSRTKFHCRGEKEIAIINYDIMPDFKVSRKNEISPGWARLLTNAGFQTVVFDECHKLKNPKAKRTVSILEMTKTIPNRIALSGTPIESRPVEFFTTLQLVSPKLFPSYWQFGVRYCGPVSNDYGARFSGASNVEELNEILMENCMIRRLKADVLTELPAKTRSVIPVEIDLKEYKRHELQMVEEMRMSLKNPKAQMNVLAAIETCKQAAIKGKLKFATEFIEDYLETGKKLVVFATHTMTIDMLQRRFGDSAVRVDGKVIGTARQRAVDKFQNDDSVRLFLGNIKAAGVGLTLTAAQDTLTLELGWTPGEHEQAEDRVHRIGQTASSVTAYYLIARGTIEEYIMSVIDGKREVLEKVLNGKEVTPNSLLSALIQQYTEKRRPRRRSL